MSINTSLLAHSFDTCNNIDLESYDKELIDAINFCKHDSIYKFRKYIENNKLLITEELYKQIVDLFVYVNTNDKEEMKDSKYYTHGRGRRHVIKDLDLKLLLNEIMSTGYVLTLTDIIHYPLAGALLKPHEIVQDNNKQTLDKIKTLIKYNASCLQYILEHLLNCDDDNIKLYARIMTFDGSNAQIKNMYKDLMIKPHNYHMLLLFDNMPCFAIKTLKSVIDFYDGHNISVSSRDICSIKCMDGLASKSMRYDTLINTIRHLKKTKSYLRLIALKTNEEINEIMINNNKKVKKGDTTVKKKKKKKSKSKSKSKTGYVIPPEANWESDSDSSDYL